MPTFGNNDYLRNYAAPLYARNASEEEFVPFKFLYDLWLKNNELNLNSTQITSIKNSFYGADSVATTKNPF